MKILSSHLRTLTLVGILLPLFLVFAYVVARSGPLAPIPVTVTEVKQQPVTPALFGIGIVEARYRYHIGPSITGHVRTLDVHVGDKVTAGQMVGAIDPVDMDNKISAKAAAMKRARATMIAAEANVAEAVARLKYSESQANRYANLLKAQTVSNETAEAKQQEYQIAKASLAAIKSSLNATRQELEILRSDYEGLKQQRENLKLIAPVDGLVVKRNIEPGSAVVAGQTVLEVIDPGSLWINVRFDQLHSQGLAANLPADILLRSRSGFPLKGRVLRIEPLADAITEEVMAKVVFDKIPAVLPPIGELAEVTVSLPQLEDTLILPNASIKRLNGIPGVWVIRNDALKYVPITTGKSSLDGQVQVLSGLQAGDRVVVYSRQALNAQSRFTIVDTLVDKSI